MTWVGKTHPSSFNLGRQCLFLFFINVFETSKEDEFRGRKAQIRDTIITLINAKRAKDILKLDGKNSLKEEIKASINTFLIDGSVIDIYYIDFQVN